MWVVNWVHTFPIGLLGTWFIENKFFCIGALITLLLNEELMILLFKGCRVIIEFLSKKWLCP